MAGVDLFRTQFATMLDKTENPHGTLREWAGMLQNMAQWESGTYTGTGSNIDVDVQGDPKMVILMDITQSCMAIHIDGMPDASYLELIAAATAYTVANGITLGTGTFRIGTDANINTNLDAGRWFALIG